MKNFISPAARRTRQAILLSALLAATTGAHAAGTASNTTVSNTATLDYAVGGINQAQITSAAATFVVDDKVDVLVTGGQTVTTGVVPGATAVATTFTVANQGNTTQDFALSINPTISGDQFDPTSCTVSNVAITTGTGGTYTAGDQHINALTPDSVATVTVTCNIPTSVANGNNGLVALVATARANDGANTLGSALTETTGAGTAGVDIVFADGAGSDDAARDAKHSARDTYQVTTAVLSVTKTVATVCDPLNGATNPKNIPGAYVQYAITVANASTTTDATLTQVTDTLAGSLAFDSKLISGANTASGASVDCSAGGGSLSASGFGVVT